MAREEQGTEAATTHALLRKINARLSSVEVRLMALEARISASEDLLFGEDEDEEAGGAWAGEAEAEEA